MVVVGRGLEGEVGPELQAAVVAAMAGGRPRGARDEEEEEKRDCNVDDDGEFAHLRECADHAGRSEIGGRGGMVARVLDLENLQRWLERGKVFDEMVD